MVQIGKNSHASQFEGYKAFENRVTHFIIHIDMNEVVHFLGFHNLLADQPTFVMPSFTSGRFPHCSDITRVTSITQLAVTIFYLFSTFTKLVPYFLHGA